jgi:hypothetical protein
MIQLWEDGLSYGQKFEPGVSEGRNGIGNLLVSFFDVNRNDMTSEWRTKWDGYACVVWAVSCCLSVNWIHLPAQSRPANAVRVSKSSVLQATCCLLKHFVTSDSLLPSAFQESRLLCRTNCTEPLCELTIPISSAKSDHCVPQGRGTNFRDCHGSHFCDVMSRSLFSLCMVCVDLCAVFRLIVVLFYVMCVICVLCLIVVRLPLGRNPFAVKIINNNKNKKFATSSQSFLSEVLPPSSGSKTKPCKQRLNGVVIIWYIEIIVNKINTIQEVEKLIFARMIKPRLWQCRSKGTGKSSNFTELTSSNIYYRLLIWFCYVLYFPERVSDWKFLSQTGNN